MKHLLTIAGSDSSGGAGIQADLKAFAAHGVFGMSVITAVTAQNTCGVTAVQDITPEIITAQIDAVFSDIRVDARYVVCGAVEGVGVAVADGVVHVFAYGVLNIQIDMQYAVATLWSPQILTIPA